MKMKILIVLCFMLFLTSCLLLVLLLMKPSSTELTLRDETSNEMVVNQYDAKDPFRLETELTLDLKGISSQSALEISRTLLKQWKGEGFLKQINEVIILDYQMDDIWVVCFNDQTPKAVGGYNIAMSKTDGRILEMWLGE